MVIILPGLVLASAFGLIVAVMCCKSRYFGNSVDSVALCTTYLLWLSPKDEFSLVRYGEEFWSGLEVALSAIDQGAISIARALHWQLTQFVTVLLVLFQSVVDHSSYYHVSFRSKSLIMWICL